MMHTRKLVLILAVVATIAAVLPVPSRAQKDLDRPAQPQAAAVSDPTQDHWWGQVSAIACGFGIRYLGKFGGNFAYDVAVVGFCLLALIDAVGN